MKLGHFDEGDSQCLPRILRNGDGKLCWQLYWIERQRGPPPSLTHRHWHDDTVYVWLKISDSKVKLVAPPRLGAAGRVSRSRHNWSPLSRDVSPLPNPLTWETHTYDVKKLSTQNLIWCTFHNVKTNRNKHLSVTYPISYPTITIPFPWAGKMFIST